MCSGRSLGISSPYSTERFIFGRPVSPTLVVTMITPLAPLAPNTAVAEASFRTEIVSTSFGSRSAKSRSTPSTRTKGAEPFQLETPRISSVASFSPGWPLDWMLVTPDSLPVRALVIFAVPELTSDLLSTCEMAPTTLSLR